MQARPITRSRAAETMHVFVSSRLISNPQAHAEPSLYERSTEELSRNQPSRCDVHLDASDSREQSQTLLNDNPWTPDPDANPFLESKVNDRNRNRSNLFGLPLQPSCPLSMTTASRMLHSVCRAQPSLTLAARSTISQCIESIDA